jgi:Uma2 family endonuclease
VPDLAGWRVERMPEPPSEAFFTLAPDWICEVLSPSTARIDRVRKMPIYARAEVGHAWLVDPAARTLEVFRLERGRWLVVGAYDEDALVRAEPFEAIELDLLRFWGMRREAASSSD